MYYIIHSEENIVNYEYLSNIILKTSDKLNSNIPELIFTALQVHYNLDLQELMRKSMQ